MLRILTLGGLSVEHAERELSGAVLQPRRLALLAVLARAGERGISRERLLALFWPDDEEERARRSLTQAVYALRRDLGDEGAIAGTQELRLDAEHIGSDIGDFAGMIKRGRLADAAALYRGPFLQGFHLVGAPDFERWADDERTAIAHDHARILDRLANDAEKDGRVDAAVEYWRVLAAVDPLNASVAVRLMRALDRTGDRAGALRHARVYEALMSQELELPPDRAVVELAAELRNAAPTDVSAAVAVSAPVSAPVRAPAPPPAAPPAAAPAPAPMVAPDPVPAIVSSPVHATSRTRTGARLALAGACTLALGALGLFAFRDRADTDIARLRATETRRVTFEEALELDPAISPDGKLVAYAGGVEGSMRIYVRQLDGGNPVAISATVTGDHRRPRWSPDGTRIAFQAERRIWVVPALGGSARVVVDPPADTTRSATSPAWSPDGGTIAWVVDRSIYARAIEHSETRVGDARVVADVENAHSLSWSPDGRFIAAASNNIPFVYGAQDAMRFASASIGNIAPGLVYVVNVSSGVAQRVNDVNFLSTSPEWLGDSHRLVYVSNRDGARDLYVSAIDDDGMPQGAPVRITTGLDLHTVSASKDGRTLAYTTFRQSANIWSVPISNNEVLGVAHATAVTTGAQTVEAMDVSPDGAWIAFDSDRGGQQDIYRVRSTGDGEPDRLVSSATDDFHPSWSADGRSIAFYSIREGYRRGAVVAASGGTPRFVGPASLTLEEHSPVWTPDGASLFFHRFGARDPDLYRIDRVGDSAWTAPRRVTQRGGIWPTFSSDGREFAYFSASGEISVMETAIGETSRHIVVPASGSGRRAMYARWAPGRRALYVRATDTDGSIGLWDVPLDGGAWRALVRFDDRRRPPARPEFATDGRRFYFTLNERIADIWTARLEAR